MWKDKILPAIGIIGLIFGTLMLILFLAGNKKEVKIKESPIVQAIEEESAGKKTEIYKTLSEIKYIQEGQDYIQLRRTLDSLLYQKADTSTYLLRKTCLETVLKQDTIIDKQEFVISTQQGVIKNDSLVKIVYKDEISGLKQDVEKEKKTSKKNRWKGRLEGGVAGLVVGYVLGNKF